MPMPMPMPMTKTTALPIPLSTARRDAEPLLVPTTRAIEPRAAVVWLTGLSGAGKSTIAQLLAQRLRERGRLCCVLDGDQLRQGLNSDLGFSDTDRAEATRRVAEVARLTVNAGLIAIAALISPLRAGRDLARSRFNAGEFIEVHVDTPLAVAEARDVKGLYLRARRGELRHFTGIDSPYEAPSQPELRLHTVGLTPAASTELLLQTLQRLRLID